jgi:hypothetical protein
VGGSDALLIRPHFLSVLCYREESKKEREQIGHTGGRILAYHIDRRRKRERVGERERELEKERERELERDERTTEAYRMPRIA